jgi:hypothetical protein
MIDKPNDATDDLTARLMNSTQRMIDEANARRIASIPEFAPMPKARKLRKRSRKHSVSHRAIR